MLYYLLTGNEATIALGLCIGIMLAIFALINLISDTDLEDRDGIILNYKMLGLAVAITLIFEVVMPLLIIYMIAELIKTVIKSIIILKNG